VDRLLSSSRSSSLLVIGASVVASIAVWALVAGPGHAHSGHVTVTGFAVSVVMWQAMMVVMMSPAATPWIAAYARVVGDAASSPLPRTLAFAAGYFTVWLGYSVLAALLQLAATRILARTGHVATPAPAGLLLIAAGAFQFTPAKRACLTHCRNPLSYLAAHWRGGPPGAFRMGVMHGAYCAGCCWLLMLTGFSMGVMNLGWMALLTVVAAAEQVSRHGVWLGQVFGAALVLWGLGLWLAA
jgi:predicted metal-binding membrane protein